MVAELCIGKSLVFRSLGKVSLKGFERAVHVHAVEWFDGTRAIGPFPNNASVAVRACGSRFADSFAVRSRSPFTICRG